MAISKNIVSLNPGFGSTDVIYQLEQQFTDLNLHGTGRSGLIVGVSSYTDPGQTVSEPSWRSEDVRQLSTTGIGTGASFYVYRNSGYIQEVRPNRPGYGYTAGDTITLSAEDFGGAANGANDVIIKPIIYAHKTSDAQTFDVTMSGTYEISGTDRNGTISGKTITVKEGDSIRFIDNLGSASYGFGIYWDRSPSVSSWIAGDQYNQYYGSSYNRVFNTFSSTYYGGGGEIITWTPECGQRGIFRVLDDYNGRQNNPITIIVEPDDSNWDYPTVGSATTFYGRFSDPEATYAWGILKHDIEPDKKYGSTYRGFQVVSDTSMAIHVGSDFYPNIGITTTFRGADSYTSAYRRNRFCGAREVDIPYYMPTGIGMFDDNSYTNTNSSNKTYTNYCQIRATQFKYTESNAYQLDLTSYKSGLNPRFVVYSYRQPTRSSTSLGGNTYSSFILHNHIGTIWDHDNFFTSGVTQISFGGGNPDNPYIQFSTYITGEQEYGYDRYPSLRAGECGYLNSDKDDYYDYTNRANTVYHPNSFKMGTDVTFNDSRIYYRGLEDRDDRNGITADMDFNAVIKGIPINTQLVPFPFYIPDDFVLIQFDYATPNANIQQGDTVTVSGSEIYEVIVGSYNQTDRTRGILFCARTT